MGLFDKSGTQIEFPLNLKPQDSCKLYLKVGLSISPKAFDILNNTLTSKNETSIYKINNLLAKNGMDIYGNSAKYIGNGSANGITVSANRLEQIFSIAFIANNHKSFTDIFSWYNEIGSSTYT